MDRSNASRWRKKEQAGPSKTPIRIPPRGKQAEAGPSSAARTAATGKIREAKDSRENIRVPRRHEGPRYPVDSEKGSKSFTVANVGANGMLYLKPSRLQASAQPLQALSPPARPSSELRRSLTDWSIYRQSNASALTPRIPARNGRAESGLPMPPLSLANNGHSRRRTRSHSFSTIDDHMRAPNFGGNEFQILVNDAERPKSSIDFTQGLLDLRIPHYRLGTPQFSERGTAYLHNSQYNSQYASSDNGAFSSSVFSRGEIEQLFPTPPGIRGPYTRASPTSYITRGSTAGMYLHPSAAGSARTPSTLHAPTFVAHITTALFDRIEAKINDPSVVRYSQMDGRILAATPARLVAQITSPQFLDYELLSDFFLTYRVFLSSYELLSYLMVRMRWALDKNTDSGRIVRVRTFVALRHWILNYFPDDFAADYGLRHRFCDNVNSLCRWLQQRQDQGGSDINVLGELKKCWRRTCAMHWPSPDALDTSAVADIEPGGDYPQMAMAGPSTSPSQSAQQPRQRDSLSQQAGPSGLRSVTPPDTTLEQRAATMQALGPDRVSHDTQRTSIPASPMSEDSMKVLSCSVPFLRHLIPSSYGIPAKSPTARTFDPRQDIPLSSRSSRPAHQHKRSGSFSDALRDERNPLHSMRPDSVDIRSLPAVAFTGGLVRGLLLQPSPSRVDLLQPISPQMENLDPFQSIDDDSQDRVGAGSGMKRIVGDMRRALSSRRTNVVDSPVRSAHSGTSTHSRHSVAHKPEGAAPTSAWQQLRGTPRVDILAASIEESYNEAFVAAQPEQFFRQNPIMEGEEAMYRNMDLEMPTHRFGDRLDSHVTTGSRSIVIMDATNPPMQPSYAGPSESSMSPTMKPQPLFQQHPTQVSIARGSGAAVVPAQQQAPVSGSSYSRVTSPTTLQMRDFLAATPAWQQPASTTQGSQRPSIGEARKSSNTYSPAINTPAVPHQIRRRPGGDLRAAENVHDLEPAQRATTGSFSTMGSPLYSDDLSGTHFSGQGLPVPPEGTSARAIGDRSLDLLPTHSSQPNLRPSFQAEISHLAETSDDAHSGSIEDALMKLEGRFGSRSESLLSDTRVRTGHTSAEAGPSQARHVPPALPLDEGGMRGTSFFYEETLTSPGTDRQGASIYHMSDTDMLSHAVQSSRTSAPSMFTYATHQPLHGHMVPATRYPISTEGSMEMPPMHADFAKRPVQTPVQASDAQPEGPARSVGSPASAPLSQNSFLLDDNQSLSEISTEMDPDAEGESFGARSFFYDDGDDQAQIAPELKAPPTPPSPFQHRSPTKETFPREAVPANVKALKEVASAPKLLSAEQTYQQNRPGLRKVKSLAGGRGDAHLPFVLAFESEVIAQQLTIIEKDALDEISWQDLIDLRWKQTPNQSRNWVEYIRHEDSNGIDIVIARFNLVVKWVVSEVILTRHTAERARCITKFIHIASRTHRLRNYASTYQITLALLSSDLTRLHRTWALVAPAEKAMLQQLEKLCQPMRNFANLRAEMEGVGGDVGCIPFIGLYTHDLMYNAQKPARVEPITAGGAAATGEPLVNFERYQTAATIVKSLLRLLEASANYVFRPHPEVLSRCLWLAALEDAEIVSRSKTLEQA